MERLSVQKKIKDVDFLTEKIQTAKTVVIFDYQGLKVSQFTDLRSKLRDEESSVKVYKNNIARRALIQAGYEDLAEHLVGAKAIAYSNTDIIAPAKIVHEFGKKNKAVEIAAGIIDGKVASKEDVQTLAVTPSRETLLTMLAVGLLQPLRELAIGLNMVAESLE